jgi:hypothetical protein
MTKSKLVRAKKRYKKMWCVCPEMGFHEYSAISNAKTKKMSAEHKRTRAGAPIGGCVCSFNGRDAFIRINRLSMHPSS